MKTYNFRAAYSLSNTLYGSSINIGDFEDIALNGWSLIGNRQTRLYKYTSSTVNGEIELPCNAEYVEAVFDGYLDYSKKPLDEYSNQWVEGYAESANNHTSQFYNKGSLVKYRQVGNSLVFDKDYGAITVLYHGIETDDEGLPLLTEKEVQAIAAYCAHVDMQRKSLMTKDGGLYQMAAALEAK